MHDYLVRGTAADGLIRAFAVTTRQVTEDARAAHDLSPVASAALGRSMAGALMMGAMMKDERDLLTLQFKGDGPIGGITVTADAAGHVKGFVGNPDVLLPPNALGKLDVGGAVGAGILRVIRDTGLKEPYTGEVDIQTGEIAQDLAWYYAASEQVPSVVALGVLVDRTDYHIRESGGYIIQVMPGCTDEVISALEARCVKADSVTDQLKAGRTPEDMLSDLLADMDFHVQDRMNVAFRCDCSEERVARALLALGRAELDEMVSEGEPVTLTCHFCGKSYTFSPEKIAALRDAAKKKA